MRLIALVDSPEHVCCRYRLRAFENELRSAGALLELQSLPHGWWSWLRQLGRFGQAEAIVVQRKLLPCWAVQLLRRRARRLIFDFDDAVFLRDSYSPKGQSSWRRWRRFAAIVRAADLVMSGNDWLAERARSAGAAGMIRVMPSCVEPKNYSMARHDAPADQLRLVWVGSSSTFQGLEQVRDLWDTIGIQIPAVRLRLICDRFSALGRIRIEPRNWNADTEANEISHCDIGVSWIPDDDWSRGKCGVKLLQYMAAGLPVVANPVGVQSQLVRHGETGFLATTSAEWVAAIRRLSASPDLRRKMGAAGRALVEREYSSAAGGQRWRDLITEWRRLNRAAG